MEFDPAIVLLGAVAVLLGAILIGVLYTSWDRRPPVGEGDVEGLHRRLEAISSEVDILAAQIRHLEEVESLQREITNLREENHRLHNEWRQLLEEVARLAELFGRQPP
jgi:hypothetical protein